MARLCDLGNNQTLAEQKWKINSDWLFKLGISGHSERIYSKPSPSRNTLWIYLICKLSPILHSTQLICNENCCFKCGYLIWWWILYSSYDLFSLICPSVSTLLPLVLSFEFCFFSLKLSPLFHCVCFYFYLFIFNEEHLESPSGLQSNSVVLSYWICGKGIAQMISAI